MSQEAIENIYTVPFYPKLNKTAPYRRTPRAIRMLKEFIVKHTKADFVIITNELNEFLWKRGIQKPPRKVKVRAIVETIDEEKIATVELIHEKVDISIRPELEGLAIPGELEEEDEEEEEEDDDVSPEEEIQEITEDTQETEENQEEIEKGQKEEESEEEN
ncbi:MAG: 50S ribosomal protein L31e [Candidatus Heimdallarchaeota archaeon]|nr:50S ribosomal protein L31e [Candidatus Heimdallarchaeota archaeon]MCK4877226.1 50S ribosomal protein L31e [Candidatus Heimdallarchaeota archaeon]